MPRSNFRAWKCQNRAWNAKNGFKIGRKCSKYRILGNIMWLMATSNIEGKNSSPFKFDIFLCWKILKGLDLHKIEPLFLGISVGGNLVLSISQRLFSGSLPLMKPCISIEGKRKHCLLTHLQSWAKGLVNQTSTTVLVWFFWYVHRYTLGVGGG